MKRVEKIINDERNLGLDFIVHIQNKQELNDLIDVLIRNHFEIQLAIEYNPNELKRWMEDIGNDYNYDVCFRIRNREDDRCVAFNPSVEHWRMFYNDILEIRNGELEFNEGDYTLDAAKIETEKIWKEIQEDGGCSLKIFEFENGITKEEVMQWVLRNSTNKNVTDKAQGVVKWFNNKLGYGFIIDNEGKEIFIHYSNIISDNKFKKLYKRQKVNFDIVETEKGTQAINTVAC